MPANTVNLSDTIKTQYEKRLLTRALPRLVHGRWGSKARMTKTGSMELRKYSALNAVTAALVEGTTPGEQSTPTISTVTMTPLWYGAYLVYTDELDMEAFDPIISEFSGILGEQAGVSADTLFRTELVADATADYSGGVAADGSLAYPGQEISYADILYQVAELEAQSALPVDGDDFVMIIHPHSYASLMQDPVFVNMFQQEAPNSALRNGFVGRILRCKIFVSSNAYELADVGVGSTTDVYHALFIAKESYGSVSFAGLDPSISDNGGPDGKVLTGQSIKPVEIIMKPLGSAGADDPLNQRGTIAWKMALDVEVLNSSWIRDLHHTNVFSND